MKERFETFTVLINRISRNIRRIKNQEMEEYGLRSAHISCLYYLYSVESLTATDLCERCEEDKATISRALLYLESKGYLICESKSAKRYKSPLILTEKGKALAQKITIKDICDSIGYSKTTLIAAYKKEFGKTVNAAITEAKLEEAKRLLGLGTLTMNEIADATGFYDQAYFSRVFSAKYGMPPSEYKREGQK